MNVENSIAATKKGFEASFKEGSLYNKQTQDITHLNQIIDALHITEECNVLDLGTGTGYVAFELAKRYDSVHVIGLDIVEEALAVNRQKAAQLHLEHLHFLGYDGITFPFDDHTFDIIVTRYALHHFPDIAHTFSELARILKKGGQLLVVDPTPNANDTSRFVDAYMKMKPDGHIKYYTKEEFKILGEKVGLTIENAFLTEIRFPRLKATAYDYDAIMKAHSKEIIAGYHVSETPDQQYIYITQKVWNISFKAR